jgi:hypothetical protein
VRKGDNIAWSGLELRLAVELFEPGWVVDSICSEKEEGKEHVAVFNGNYGLRAMGRMGNSESGKERSCMKYEEKGGRLKELKE